MGVEYRHYFIVTDLSWLGQASDVLRIHACLEHWGLVSKPPAVYDCDGGRRVKVRSGLKNTRLPPNLLVEYPGVRGAPGIPKIMGASYYDAEDESRYFMRLKLTVGSDFHVHPSTDYYGIEVLTPPQNGKKAVAACARDLSLYPAKAGTRPPKTRVELGHPSFKKLVPKEFTGVWRAALELDCGKDLPKFADRAAKVPGKRFVKEIAEAFGTELHQVGVVY